MLSVPEDFILRQFYQDSKSMYFVIKGDCVVRMVNNFGKEVTLGEKDTVKLLVEGESFGEISMLYGCERQATIISRGYNILASLTYN